MGHKMLPVSSTINDRVGKRCNREIQQNRQSGSLALEKVENTTTKLSESKSPLTVSVKSNYATIAEAVAAMKKKREEKKNLNKVAPADIHSGRNCDLDLSALKIGSVRGRRLACITK